MPLTLVQGSGIGAWGSATTGTGTGSISVSWNGPRTVGSLLLLALNSDSTESTPSGWNLDKSQINDSGCYLFRRISDNTATDTPTFSSAFAKCIAWAEYTGNSATPQDVFASAGTGVDNSNPFSTGTTATTAQSDELAVAVFGTHTASNTTLGNPLLSSETNSFVEQVDVSTNHTGVNCGLGIATKDLSSTGTQECTVTPSVVCGQSAIMGTYKASSSFPGEEEAGMIFGIAASGFAA